MALPSSLLEWLQVLSSALGLLITFWTVSPKGIKWLRTRLRSFLGIDNMETKVNEHVTDDTLHQKEGVVT